MGRSRLDAVRVAMLLVIVFSTSLATEVTSAFLGNQEIVGPHLALFSDPSYQISVAPRYMQEGLDTTLTVSVQAANDTKYPFRIDATNPAGASHSVNISVTTNATGFGENSTIYWSDFSGADTDLVGVYNVALRNATTLDTIHIADFTVGLTDKFDYRRNEIVQVRGSGYSANESVTVDIRFTDTSVEGYPKPLNASNEGVVNASWRVPVEGDLGNYTLSIVNATTPGTVKAQPDIQNFTVFGEPSYDAFAEPHRIQEGNDTIITVTLSDAAVNTTYTFSFNVTDPRGNVYSASLSVTTNATGFGSNSIKYWSGFTSANTDFTGTYTVAVNKTLASTEFIVGLTDKTEYRRNETVQIQATGYGPSELVTVNIKIGAWSVDDFPKNFTADDKGKVVFSWTIPFSATSETYSVVLTNATSEGTSKTPQDSDYFKVLGVLCKVKAENRAGEGVPGTLVEVYNATTANVPLINGTTNSTGWILFNLDGGEYNFKAFFKNVEVSSRSNQNVTVDTEFDLPLSLVNVVATVESEKGEGVPFIDIALKHNYTTRDNKNMSETLSTRTNLTGMGEVHNLFTNTTYKVEAKRFGMLFNSTTLSIEPFPGLAWISLNLILPNNRLNVHVLDSQNKPADEIQVKVHEWTSGVTTPLQSDETKAGGEASFLLPFGRYLIRAFKGDAFLNETVINLIEDPVTFTFHLVTLNVGVTVSVFDYFGQPIANAKVEIDRKINQDYLPVDGGFTGAGGSTTFALTVGGDSRISVYVAGRLAAVKTQFLSIESDQVTFNIGEYVAVLGYPIETGLFALMSFLIVVVAVVLVLVRGRLMKSIRTKLKR